MAQEELSPYIEQKPRDLLTADNWNEMQRRIKEDIRATSREAAEAIERVARADDSDRLEGLSADELKTDIIKKALDEVRARRGYLQVFRVLEMGEESVIEHGFGACPLVDVYQLDYFPVVCCEDKEEYPAWVTFYFHHGGEGTLRYTGTDNQRRTLEIQPRGGPSWGIRLADFLDRYKISPKRDQTLADLETEIWDAFFAHSGENNFQDPQYGHSVWFDKCCREEKRIRELSQDWDDLWIQMRPRKTVNYPGVVQADASTGGTTFPGGGWMYLNLSDVTSLEEAPPSPAPTQIQVAQYGWNTVGVELLGPPVYPAAWFEDNPLGLKGFPPLHTYYEVDKEDFNELKVMVLLKC